MNPHTISLTDQAYHSWALLDRWFVDQYKGLSQAIGLLNIFVKVYTSGSKVYALDPRSGKDIQLSEKLEELLNQVAIQPRRNQIEIAFNDVCDEFARSVSSFYRLGDEDYQSSAFCLALPMAVYLQHLLEKNAKIIYHYQGDMCQLVYRPRVGIEVAILIDSKKGSQEAKLLPSVTTKQDSSRAH